MQGGEALRQEAIGQGIPSTAGFEGRITGGGFYASFKRILTENDPVGTVYLRASLKPINDQIRIENVVVCTTGYAEPGYSDPKSGIIAFGNWNDVSHWVADKRTFKQDDNSPCRVAKLLERLGAQVSTVELSPA